MTQKETNAEAPSNNVSNQDAPARKDRPAWLKGLFWSVIGILMAILTICMVTYSVLWALRLAGPLESPTPLETEEVAVTTATPTAGDTGTPELPSTGTPVSLTETPTATGTLLPPPPTFTSTPLPPPPTVTSTPLPPPPTVTSTPLLPSPTSTLTPTATNSPTLLPTGTSTAAATDTPTPLPPNTPTTAVTGTAQATGLPVPPAPTVAGTPAAPAATAPVPPGPTLAVTPTGPPLAGTPAPDSTVTSPFPPVFAPDPLDSLPDDYIVQEEDWLSKLSLKFYGDVRAYPIIVEATNAKALTDDSYAFIEDPDLIEIGWKIHIPAISEIP